MTADSRRRILIVEDEPLIAMAIEDMLLTMGWVAIGPACRLADALRLAELEPLDGAILDVNLGGQDVYPVADVLLRRGIGFLLASGYGDWALPAYLRNRPRLQKPYDTKTLRQLVDLTFG